MIESESPDELIANAARREGLRAQLAAAHEPPPLLYPNMVHFWQQQITELRAALEEDACDSQAREVVRPWSKKFGSRRKAAC